MPDYDLRVRVAVVGAGYFGQFHFDARTPMPEVEIVAICVRDAAAAAETAKRYGSPAGPLPVFTDLAQMMRAARPALIDITAPPGAHLELIRALAPFRPDIICQKPLCGGVEARVRRSPWRNSMASAWPCTRTSASSRGTARQSG